MRCAAHCSSICSDGRELGVDAKLMHLLMQILFQSTGVLSTDPALGKAPFPRLSVPVSVSSAQSVTTLGCQVSQGEALRGSQVTADTGISRASLLTLSTIIHNPCTPRSLNSANTHYMPLILDMNVC